MAQLSMLLVFLGFVVPFLITKAKSLVEFFWQINQTAAPGKAQQSMLLVLLGLLLQFLVTEFVSCGVLLQAD